MDEKKYNKLQMKKTGLNVQLAGHSKFINNLELENKNKAAFLINSRLEELDKIKTMYMDTHSKMVEVVLASEEEGIMEKIEGDYCSFLDEFLEIEYLFISKHNDVKTMNLDTASRDTKVAIAGELHNLDNQVVDNSSLPNANLRNNNVSTASSVCSGCSENSVNRQNSDIYKNFKLPRVPLPKFDGKEDNWPTFRDAFDRMIIKNPNLTNFEKYYYLDGSVSDDASKIIKKIEYSENAFNLAWTALLSRFNNERLIIDRHINKFFGLKAMKFESETELQNLLDDSQIHLGALKVLGEELSDVIVLHTVKSKLDKETLRYWENELKSDEVPTWFQMLEFLQRRIRILKAVNSRSGTIANKPTTNSPFYSSKSHSKSFVASVDNQKTVTCSLCKINHFISSCPQFLELSPKQRYVKTKELRLCLNCLRLNHRVMECRAPRCSICQKKHHQLLHLETGDVSNFQNVSSSDGIKSDLLGASSSKSNIVNSDSNSDTFTGQLVNMTDNVICRSEARAFHVSEKQVILSTASVLIRNVDGKYILARALLDSGSMSNFVSFELADQLGIKKEILNSSVGGLNNTHVTISQKINALLKSRLNQFKLNLELLVVPEITNRLPLNTFDISAWPLVPSLHLADPKFNIDGKVDLLLGAELYYKILKNGRYELSPNLPILQATQLGWIVGGSMTPISYNFFINSESEENVYVKLDNKIQKFWEMETFEESVPMSLEEKTCEKIFKDTHYRNSNGQYVVNLPLKDSVKDLGDSQKTALKRFKQLEYRMSNNNDLKTQYTSFMREYESLGHMELSVTDTNTVFNKEYYLPHHAVLKPDSTSTKLRVVFDASSKTSTGLSLNDVLMVGPIVQPDLFSIVIRFRLYTYAMTTDVQKMYRQTFVEKEHQQLQKIFWRENTSEPIKTYNLKTVTYGTSAAPYLATRALQQLAFDEKNNFPLASKVALTSFYVDDLLSGSNDLEEALEIQKELIGMLQTAGMKLRKWVSSHPALLQNIPIEDREVIGTQNETIKTLGLHWNSITDVFRFQLDTNDFGLKPTKRHVLSCIASLFDPLGLVAPVVVKAKIIMQKIWLEKIEWDEEVSNELKLTWNVFYRDLDLINSVDFNRCIIPVNTAAIEIHGFADASQSAYGACIYVRCLTEDGDITTNLFCSKSRIAPLKIISIPRLELNAALLLSKLVTRVMGSMSRNVDKIILWSDSSIVLCWLKLPPNQLKTYVANRVCIIQELTMHMSWRHVDSKNNAADILSRGVMPSEFEHDCPSWIYGPSFLRGPEHDWPSKFQEQIEIPDLKEVDTKTYTNICQAEDVIIIENYSYFTKLRRITAYCIRFINNCKIKHQGDRKRGRILEPEELELAERSLVYIVQQKTFQLEINRLRVGRTLSKNSKYLNLTPFIDDYGCIRVGGRLDKSSLDFNEKHQYLLPHHHFTTLLVRHIHHQNLHSGTQQTLSTIRRKYWIINGKNLVKKTIHQCMPCFRAKPKLLHQILGNLPKSRIDATRPFQTAGIDYCGPFSVRYRNQRKETYQKVYICIFVCFVTKAVHLEVVEDATADCFIACLKRFFSRRGRSTTLWSDNGTNFVGAHNKLKDMEMCLSKNSSEIELFCSNLGIKWIFIPPRTPHFGGLWESGVKILKMHLKRIVGNKTMTLEMIYTLVVEIEGVMNSRPISELSTDPTDLEPLTPGHFLTLGPINSIPEANITHLPSNRLSQWRQIEQIIQHFWRRFNLEYIQSLQKRQKWKTPQDNLKVNELVLIMDEQLPSTYWMIGRVQEVVMGQDGRVRSAKLKTKAGVLSRGITKLARLPALDETSDTTPTNFNSSTNQLKGN